MIRPIVVSLMPFSLPLDWLSTAVMMMMSGSAGMTRNTLDTADMPSPAAPDR